MGISVAALVSGCSVASAADTLFIGCILDDAFCDNVSFALTLLFLLV